ncbi:hypothetical protein [Schnuerera sp.]|uniref:hypothetical protein n=1 Tax=Schnuerera sp. TaxID=2794844 RepID=UPI002C579A65|nr:hypothetical protein [Schnuerera sp.]HSH35257.1 hypothetical protein [Schnuerera sp.]
MYPQDYEQRHPAVPPLYPMDPCRPKPMPYEPEPMPTEPYIPMDPNMPYMPYMPCPMMDPRFRDCVRVCMMQCGHYPMHPQYPMGMPPTNYPEEIK